MMEPAKPNKKNLNMTDYKVKGFGNEQMPADPKFTVRDDDTNDNPEEVAGAQNMTISKKAGSVDTNKDEELNEAGRGMKIGARGAEDGDTAESIEDIAGNKGDESSLGTTGTLGEEKVEKKADY